MENNNTSSPLFDKILELANQANELYENGAHELEIRVKYLQIKRYANKAGLDVPEKDPRCPNLMLDKIKNIADLVVINSIPNHP